MDFSRAVPVLFVSLALAASARAQQAEPGTADNSVQPASASQPAASADLRTFSSPTTDVVFPHDFQPEPADFGLGANPYRDLGLNIFPAVPEGMLAKSPENNPFLIYDALPHRSGQDIALADATIIDGAQEALVKAAAYHGYNLKQSGWVYQQALCPALQPDAEARTGVPAGNNGQGSILLHFMHEEGSGRVSAFSAVLPRDGEEPRVIAATHGSVESHYKTLSAKTSGSVVNKAIPDELLYNDLQPEKSWLSTAACIAEMGGAYPHVPDWTYSNEEVIMTPAPLLRIRLDGKRDITLGDRIDATHFVVWNEHVSRHGRMLGAEYKRETFKPLAVTNPPLPKVRNLAEAPQPKSKITAPPPSPLEGMPQ